MVCATSLQTSFALVVITVTELTTPLQLINLLLTQMLTITPLIVPHTISAWNSLHEEHVTAPSVSAFKYYFYYY